MNKYGLFTKTSYELIIMTHKDNIKQAKNYGFKVWTLGNSSI